jgi:hypothetical protein
MELNELQQAWKKLSSDSAVQQSLDEVQISAMLGKRTRSLMDRLDVNIRIGFAVILVFILGTLLCDFIQNTVKPVVPTWLIVLDSVVNLSIVALFVSFIIHYYKIRRQCGKLCDIRHTLLKVTGVLSLYQRLFSLALVIIVLDSATGFISGFYTSIHANQTAEGFLFPVLVIGILFLVMLTALIFLLLRWIFRKSYGNYLDQLRKMLRELDEPF